MQIWWYASGVLVLLLVLSACQPAVLRPVDQELVQAATVGDAIRVDAALRNGAAAGAKGRGGWTPLMLAARNGDASVVSTLLKQGVDVNVANDSGQTALMVCPAGIVRLLTAAGADVNARKISDQSGDTIDGETALMITSDVDKTHALLQAGADLNACTGLGATALTYAALRGESARVAMLLQAGADVSVNGRSTLIDAAYQGDGQTVTLLLQAGADVHVRVANGRTPLHFAAMNLRHGVLQAVLAAHPDVNSQSDDGNTPLILAAGDAALENVRTLLAAGADPEIRNAAGKTAMDWATSKHNAEMIAALSSRGAASPTASVGVDNMRRTARAERDAVLEVLTTDVATDGRVAKIRGRVRNNYARRVEGIRYEIVLIEASSGRQLDTIHQDIDTTLSPGQEVPMSLDVQSMYFGSDPRFLILAFPAKLTPER